MPTRLLLDGEDLPALMLRVKAEMGPDARIVKAERIRTGGIAGFFAREHYELTVEVPETRPSRGRRRPAAPPAPSPAYVLPGDAAGIDALLAAADAAERADVHGSDLDGSSTARAPVTPAIVAAPPAQISTSGDTFARVLQSMREIVGPLAEDEEPLPPGAAAPEPSAESPAPTDPPAAPLEPSPVAAFAAAPAAPAASPETLVERPRSSVATLLELGVPVRLLGGFTDPHAAVALSLLVRSFESAPRLRLTAGTVVAVVGERGNALRTATQMAHRAGMEAEEIVLAGDIGPVAGHGRRLQTAAAVARFRSRLSADEPTVVVIGVDLTRERWDEPAALLEALAPDQAWAVLDARRRAVELRRWLRGVGERRPFDAIAAVRTFDAQAPGTVLNLGTPVGWVDGLPASPVVWASVLSERLADDARWD